MTIDCPNCETSNFAGNRLCKECGKPLRENVQTVRPPARTTRPIPLQERQRELLRELQAFTSLPKSASAMEIYCSQCGTTQNNSANFCPNCGGRFIVQPTKKSNTVLWGFCIFCLFAGGLLMLASISNNKTSSPKSSTVYTNNGSNSSSSNFSDDADQAAMQDLRTYSWVKDLYVSPGHMNIGVIRGEKDWSAPMISSYACGVLRKHDSKLKWVRFVDIQAVAYQGQSPSQAEIYKFDCR
jgi:hypothetical protein